MENEGLKVKYNVFKVKDGTMVNGCFVLRPQKDRAARKALLTYAAATENATLADDIRNWIASIESAAEGEE